MILKGEIISHHDQPNVMQAGDVAKCFFAY